MTSTYWVLNSREDNNTHPVLTLNPNITLDYCCFGEFRHFPRRRVSVLSFCFLSVNVSGRRLVTTLPKYVRLWQSDTKQKRVGRVGVKHRESKDPHDQNTPSDNTLITLWTYTHTQCYYISTTVYVNAVALSHSYTSCQVTRRWHIPHIKISLLSFSLSLCEISQSQPLARDIMQTLWLRCAFDMCNCMFSLRAAAVFLYVLCEPQGGFVVDLMHLQK